MPTESVLGYPVAVASLEECIKDILFCIESTERNKKYFVCANPHSIQIAQTDSLFDEALKNADLVVPDGVGVVLASRILQGKIKDRITGSDIFWGLNKRLNTLKGTSYFFLGSTEETLKAIKEKMTVEYPNIRFAGSYSPPYKAEFSSEDSRKMVEAVNAVKPDVLWVGMTAPKQEKWIYQNKDKLDVKFIGAIGAVFDFYVGNVKRSHPVFQKMGLEWLPRLLQEPRRLFKRNFVSSPLFLLRVLQQRCLGKNSY